MINLRIISLVLPLFLIGGEQPSAGQTKPTKTEPIYTYFKAPPDTLQAMLAEVDLVLSGSVVGARPADSIDPSGVLNVRTLFKVTATEVFRNISSQVVDDAIEVARSVGERDRGAYIERVIQDGFPSFEIGRNYLMFLKWSDAQNAWVPAFGPDSVLDLTDGIAESAGKAKVTQTLKGKQTAKLLETVRRGGL